MHIPIGTAFCLNHVIEKGVDDEMLTTENQQSDDEYFPDESIIPEEKETLFQDSPLSTTLEALHSSPLKFQVKRKYVNELSEGTKTKIKQKYNRAKKLFKHEFAASVVPEQDESVLDILSDSSEEEHEVLEDDIKHYLKLYKSSDNKSRMVILSLIDPTRYSKEQLMELFNCSRYNVDQARKWRNTSTGLCIPDKQQFKREGLTLPNVNIFLTLCLIVGFCKM